MTTAVPEEIEETTEATSMGPGEKLRAARVSLGYELARVAADLHLTEATIEALERDEYEGMPARVFVRGYINKYANLVGLPAQPLLAMFDQNWPEASQTTVVDKSDIIPKLPSDVRSENAWMTSITWIVLVGAIVLFLVWWRGYLDDFVEQTSLGGSDEQGLVESTADVSLNIPTPSPQQDQVQPEKSEVIKAAEKAVAASQAVADKVEQVEEQSEIVKKAAEEASTSAETQPEKEPAVVLDPVIEEPSTPVTLTIPAQPQAVVEEEQSQSEVTPTPVAAAALETTENFLATDAEESEAVAQVALPAKGVVFEFTAPCWVDVRDSSRKFKLFGEMAKGSQKVLGGEAPYKVVLGNAKAVKITVDGKPYDFSSFARGNVARFTLSL